jgi:O-antigen ligase
MSVDNSSTSGVRVGARRTRLFDEVREQPWLETVALLLFLTCVAIAPFPYGAITQGGELTIELLAFTVLALLFLDRPRLARLRGARVTVMAMAGLTLLGIIQWTPLPRFLLSIVSPLSARIYADAGSTLATFGRPAPLPRISIAPSETLATVLITLAYLALFTAGALLLRSRLRRRLFVAVLLGSVLLHVIVGTVMRSVAADPVDEIPVAAGRLHGAFVNPNHFAGYLEIALAVAFGLLWRELLHYGSSVRRGEQRGRQFENLLIKTSLRALVWGVIAAGIALTESRGGILCAGIVMVVMLSIAPLHPRIKSRRWSLAAAGLGAMAAAVGLTALAVKQQPILRFLASDPRDPASDLRFNLWQLSVEAWQRFPLLGSGLGTFRDAFRHVQPRNFNYLVEFAHSDPLQLLVTGGAIGFLLGATAVVALLVALLKRWHREQRREESAFLLAAFGAILSLALHGLMEFNLSIPAIPATLACVAGFGWASAHAEEEEREHRHLQLVTSA